jgi:hypothetical protein
MRNFFVPALTILLLLSVSPAMSATWNLVGADDTDVAFFDADTVVKTGDTVTLWVKYVKNTNVVVADGVYAAAVKMNLSCTKHTVRLREGATYDRDGKFIEADADSATPVILPVEAGPIDEIILQAACTADFPKSKSREFYYPVAGNDVFRFTASYFENMKNSQTDPAPQTDAVPTKQVVGRNEWLVEIQDILPASVCISSGYFRSCYDISADECHDLMTEAIKSCASQYRTQIPAQLEQPEDGTKWGTKIGVCAGTIVEPSLSKRRIPSEKCNDPSAWR